MGRVVYATYSLLLSCAKSRTTRRSCCTLRTAAVTSCVAITLSRYHASCSGMADSTILNTAAAPGRRKCRKRSWHGS
eukprot:scaffold86895_cov34-Prasinocladus_malaysianus.AAC.3